ncbi:uncharacterized protein B0T15DRAFT_310650 [Chaetomium strumarium]|uniref:Riboflavin kinase n=1 Tax=Chaetomium strumarium TaxID=1170767 RepID=A0AAJ0GMB1_9PEZI|nr:hypothetical protein B0T15DRAFT_310650 [Chaetomium strumarium]
MEVPASLQIRRKPVATPQPPVGPVPDPEFVKRPPPLPDRPAGDRLRLDTQLPTRPVSRGAEPSLLQVPGHRLRPQTSMPELSRFATDSQPPSPFNAAAPVPAATFGPGISDSKKSFVQAALSEARHFAGGLIPHPTESTKHYTILRHSPPLIFYRGPTTSVAITIFSSPDHPLPNDRTLWLQQRGFSGDSGMKIKAFFNATDDWLHVTPSTQVHVDQLPPDTERTWQRDIGKAAKKLLKDKGHKKAHVPRETHVIRIPEASDDGYFRLILCTGKGTPFESSESKSRCKTLCTSPIFRVASASADSSVFRGASLSTLPLEMGVFVASVVATTAVDKYTAPVKEPVQAVLDKVRPGLVAETVGSLVADELNERSAERDAERDRAFHVAHQAHVARAVLQADSNATGIHAIGPDSGPEPPFPLEFQGKVVAGTGRSQAELGMPTANLAGVPDEIRYRLKGVYFGWAQVVPPKKQQDPRNPNLEPYSPPWQKRQWHEAIITIAPSAHTRPSVLPKPEVTIHLLNFTVTGTTGTTGTGTNLSNNHTTSSSPDRSLLLGLTLKTLIMGLLRPIPLPPPPPLFPPHLSPLRERPLDACSRDICLTLVSLSDERENWRPGATLLRLRQQQQHEDDDDVLEKVMEVEGQVKKGMGMVPGMARVQTTISKVVVPLQHRVGIRGGGEEDRAGRDRVLGVGGFWVAR